MKVPFTFRHMDATEDVKRYAEDKLAKLARYEDREIKVHTIFSTEKYHQNVEFTVTGTGHGTFVAHESKEDMFEAIDLAVDKLDRQLSRDKDRRKHHKGHQGSTPNEIG